MISRCSHCDERYAAANVFRGTTCPSCGAARRRQDRRCAIADRLGRDERCPRGGCHLARLLGVPRLGDADDPCEVEEIALRQPDNPLVLQALDDLRRELREEVSHPRLPGRSVDHRPGGSLLTYAAVPPAVAGRIPLV
jgi:hypothetical protein